MKEQTSDSTEFDPIQALQRVGVTPESCFLRDDQTLGGMFTAKPVRFDNSCHFHPWDKLGWFESTTGGGDGRGSWKGGYRVHLKQTPKPFREKVWAADRKLKEAEKTVEDLLAECDRRAQKARAEAVQELGVEAASHRELEASRAMRDCLVPKE